MNSTHLFTGVVLILTLLSLESPSTVHADGNLIRSVPVAHSSVGDSVSAAEVSGERWLPPFARPLVVSEPYSLPNGPYRAGHRGIDIPASLGAAVRSPTSGTVSFVGSVVDRPVLSVRVDTHTVLSVEPVASDLAEGDPVTRGQLIGTVSSGGHCAEHCLHLGVRINDEYVNPLRFLRQRPVLLPW